MDRLITVDGFMKVYASVALALLFTSSTLATPYISYHYGYHGAQQEYLEDGADQQSIMQSIDLNLLSWRLSRTGLVARGPRIQWQQAQHFDQLLMAMPIYHWTPDHGAFFEYKHNQWQLETTWAQNRIYLQDTGTALATGTGTSSFESEQTHWQLYWYEGVNDEGPINRVGISYLQVKTPASASLTGINADIFDTTFSGWGIQLGRIKRDPGFNFQWLLHIHNMQTDFSNDVTQHRQQAAGESKDYRMELDLNWHHRYRIEPYWYWVPKIGTRLLYQTQSAIETQTLEHDAYTALDWYASFGLQITF